jgi:hypothetical protein
MNDMISASVKETLNKKLRHDSLPSNTKGWAGKRFIFAYILRTFQFEHGIFNLEDML